MSKIPEHLIEKINKIPLLPGIYKMIDKERRIIYIGKSISLKKRVKSYFIGTHKINKIERMISLINDIEYIVTDTHLEARLLECELIKTIKPIFNVQFKNDKKYAYLKINDYNIHSSISLTNKKEENTFGPFRQIYLISSLINSFKNLYPIVERNNEYNFEYNLFPVNMNKENFEINKKSLMNIFSDNENLLLFIDRLEEKMKILASNLEFATAAIFRDIIYSLKYLSFSIYGKDEIFHKNLILKIPIPYGYKLFFVSKGKILLKESYSSLSQQDIEIFIELGESLISSEWMSENQKAVIDFRDILYSEIKSLPEEMVLFQEK
jgi:excinuclease ABC subunit C